MGNSGPTLTSRTWPKYDQPTMKHELSIFKQAFDAIAEGRKTLEVRTNTSYESFDYSNVKAGDLIEFRVISGPPFVDFNEIGDERMLVEVLAIHHYASAEELFEKQGIDWLSFQPQNHEEALQGLYQIKEYEESIAKNGIYAFSIKPKN